jgi:paraquat-inducible protein A
VSDVSALIACHDCDLLQRRPSSMQPGLGVCPRCGAVLVRRHGTRSNDILSLALTCAVLFLIANIYPIVTLESQGQRVSSTLLGAIQLLWSSGMPFVSLLVLATSFLIPGAEIGLLIAALLKSAPDPRVLHLLEHLRPWAMLDVFVLGVLVSIRKLADMADIIPGPALWAFVMIMLLTTLMRDNSSLQTLWARVVRLPPFGTPHAR